MSVTKLNLGKMHFCLQDKEQYTALLIRDAAHWTMYKIRGKFRIGAKQLGPQYYLHFNKKSPNRENMGAW